VRWTKERTTWLGTFREKRGSWHRIPYVLRASTTRGMTRGGWAVLVLVLVLLIGIILVEELFL
jgi:hypothetical protein